MGVFDSDVERRGQSEPFCEVVSGVFGEVFWRGRGGEGRGGEGTCGEKEYCLLFLLIVFFFCFFCLFVVFRGRKNEKPFFNQESTK